MPRATNDPEHFRLILARRMRQLGWGPAQLAAAAGQPSDRASVHKYLAEGSTYHPQVNTVARWLAAAGGRVTVAWQDPAA